jgi:hypothetical protein
VTDGTEDRKKDRDMKLITTTNITTAYVPCAAGCRVCNTVSALLRKADRLDTIAAGYADLAIRAELHASAESDRARAARIHCTTHRKAA